MQYDVIVRHREEDAEGLRAWRERFPELKEAPEKVDRYGSFLEALRMAESRPALHAESAILLSDDAWHVINREIAARPSEIIQFFSTRKADTTVGSRWDRSFMWTTCFYIPQGCGPCLADYCEVARGEGEKHYDLAIAKWIKESMRRIWIVCPNPVDRVGGGQWTSKTFNQ